jgi:RNase P subunit RPR2
MKIPTSNELTPEKLAMERSNIWGYCDACDAPLLKGLKRNLAPCPGHPDHLVAYCDGCVREAEARVKAPNPR